MRFAAASLSQAYRLRPRRAALRGAGSRRFAARFAFCPRAAATGVSAARGQSAQVCAARADLSPAPALCANGAASRRVRVFARPAAVSALPHALDVRRFAFKTFRTLRASPSIERLSRRSRGRC